MADSTKHFEPSHTSVASRWPNVDPDDSDTDEEYLTHKCRRFRILVIGCSGVGKSTLLSMVFGVSEESMGVVHQGIGRGHHSVWNARTSRNNPLLALHDSGGFEAGETSNLEEVKRFVAHCASMTDLENKLHCICCTAARLLLPAEQELLASIRHYGVPIVFVLTKFDLVVAECLQTRFIQLAHGRTPAATWTPNHTLALARGDAREIVRADVQRPLERYLGGGVRTEIVSNTDRVLVKQLVEETTRVITPNLKKLWIGAQQVIASNKRERSISSSIKAVSTTYVRAGILIPVPLIKPLFHQDIFNRMYDTIRLQWNICDCGHLERDSVINQFRTLCSNGGAFAFGRAVDPSGIFSGPLYAREYLRWAADLNIIFEILFWRVKERGQIRRLSQNEDGNGQRVLASAELNEVLDKFAVSNLRNLAHSMISGRVGSFNFSLPFKRKDLKEILQIAVDTAIAEGEKEGLWTKRPPALSPSSTGRLAELD